MSVSGSGGGTGGGLGRGRGGALMQSILDRKRQEEENQRRLERELALEEELNKQQKIESEKQQQDNPPASTGVGGIPRVSLYLNHNNIKKVKNLLFYLNRDQL